ncbi:MAG: HEPN domain-containing protein [Bacteroidaceae bacterium]|nr:HEPN domain-containing protein [Bacteroidaceae bacterium]
MTNEERVKYWLDIAAGDLDTAEYLFKGGRWLYVAFMCHQVIEKTLKAYWTASQDDDPPYTHSHIKLIEGCGLMPEINEEMLRFLAMMVPMNIEARYPQYKQNVAATLNQDVCEHILEQTKRLHQWILQKL